MTIGCSLAPRKWATRNDTRPARDTKLLRREGETAASAELGIPTMSGKKTAGPPRVKAATVEALMVACST
jgi:hypothetical protein